MSKEELMPNTSTSIEINLWYPFYVDLSLNVQRPVLHFYLCNTRVNISFPSGEELKRVLKELLNRLEGGDE